jgi:2-dehydropantoate 2-reductase
LTRVCVLGAGSIGSLFAGHLAAVADVTVLTRRPEHAEALRRDGLRVSGRSERLARVAATDEPDELGPTDLVIVATKAAGLEPASAALQGHVPEATVMTVLNGLGAEEVVRRHGAWPILSAVTFMSGTRHSDTHVEYVLDTETWIGPYEDAPYASAVAVADLVSASGLKAAAFEDLRPAQWSKLIFNATVNAVAALTGLPHDAHFAAREHPGDLGHLVYDLMAEGRAVADAAGIHLHEDPWDMNVHATQRGSAHWPSMLEDVLAGRPTEIELITGSLIREAARCGVAAPLHTAMYRLVRAREASIATPDVRA